MLFHPVVMVTSGSLGRTEERLSKGENLGVEGLETWILCATVIPLPLLVVCRGVIALVTEKSIKLTFDHIFTKHLLHLR